MSSKLQDKKSIMGLFAGILHDASILGNSREFPIELDDFIEPFHKMIYGAMKNLYVSGAEKIDVIDIDSMLSNYPQQYKVFQANNGVEYLLKVKEAFGRDNFELHYQRVRKYSFLRSCDSAGIDIRDLYDVDNLDKTKEELQQARFDKMTLEEMVLGMEAKMIGLRDQFLFNQNNAGGSVGDISDEILGGLLNGNQYGANIVSPYFTAATMGARKGRVYLVSAPSGAGKSRLHLGSAKNLVVPFYYEDGEWKENKFKIADEGVLYIGTELEEDEFVEPLLCSIADVDETKVKEGRATPEEKERLLKANEILKETNLYYEKLLDFDLADIEHAINKYVNKHNVGYVFHDYIHDSVKLMASFNKINKQGVREDQRLLQVMTRLKEIAQQKNIFIMTSTQLNSNHKLEGAYDETAIAGAKSMVNKVDIGSIMSPLNKSDEVILNTIKNSHPNAITKEPNITINIFKSRGTKWKMIRIWVHFDHGRLKIHDQFVTDYKGSIITEIEPVEVMLQNAPEIEEKEISFINTEEKYSIEEDTATLEDDHDFSEVSFGEPL